MSKTNDKITDKMFDKALKFIIERKIPVKSIATHIGKGVPLTHEKIHRTRNYKFNDNERIMVIEFLQQYKKELDAIF